MIVTGVAPWAFSDKEAKGNSFASRPSLVPRARVHASAPPPSLPQSEASAVEANTDSGYKKVMHYIDQCIENAGGLETGQVPQWSLEQANMKPVLLPELKFHDLVFGKYEFSLKNLRADD